MSKETRAYETEKFGLSMGLDFSVKLDGRGGMVLLDNTTKGSHHAYPGR